MTEKVAAKPTAEELAKKTADDIKATRESIKVTTGRASGDEVEETEEEIAAKAAEVEAAEAAEVAAKAAETVEASEEKIEELEEQKAEAKTATEKDKFQKRIDRETAKRKALETEIKELKAKLAAEPDKANALTEEEVERRSEEKAQAKQTQREFDLASNRLFDAGTKADKEFPTKIKVMADDIGGIPGHLVGILDDLENSGELLVYFTDNADEFAEIYALSPAQAALKLAKLSNKLIADKKPKPKEISKVPDPAETIKGGSSKASDVLPKNPTDNMAEFVRIRAKQADERRRAKMGLH